MDESGFCTEETECRFRRDELDRLERLVLQAYQRYVIRGGGFDPTFEADARAIVRKRQHNGEWIPLGVDRDG
jgi:hypothetical protein